MPFAVDFATLEGHLATINYIANDKRTAFQAHLKSVRWLGFPAHLTKVKGRSTRYILGQFHKMALVIECTQLGLSPERTIQILNESRFTTAHLAVASVASLKKHPKGFPNPDPETGNLKAASRPAIIYFPIRSRSRRLLLTSFRNTTIFSSESDIDRILAIATGGRHIEASGDQHCVLDRPHGAAFQ